MNMKQIFGLSLGSFFHGFAALAVVVALIAGAICIKKSREYPVYTDREAPARLSLELNNLPREQRFSEWYKQLATYETPHKRLQDLGCGLLALGVGLLLSFGLAYCYKKTRPPKKGLFFLFAWIFLWILPALFSPWYYSVRQKRFDYPSWGDSIIIGVFSDVFAFGLGCVILGVAARILMIGHEFPASLRPRLPQGFIGWSRGLLLAPWIVILLATAESSVRDGSVGVVLSSLGFFPLLFAMLWAKPRIKEPEENSTKDVDHVGSPENASEG